VTDGIRCKVCDVGTLERLKVHRMSPIVVVIGYILLIPSALGVIASAVGLLSTGAAESRVTESARLRAAGRLERDDIPDSIVDKVRSGHTATESELVVLSNTQRASYEREIRVLNTETAGSGAGVVIAGGIAIAFGVLSVVGGLLGWLLIMKKTVLKCTRCSAAIAAV